MIKRSLKKSASLFETVLLILLTAMALITIYPFYNVLIISFADTATSARYTPYWYPHVIDLTGYQALINDAAFLRSLGITVFVTVAGVCFSMFLCITAAYSLSKKRLPGRNIILSLILFTMLFSGGMIPTYLVVKALRLTNTVWAMILPPAINTYYLIIMKNYFASLPPSLEEAAKIDGATEFIILPKIYLPISAPFMATFSLFYAVERWNEWWNAYIYINKKTLAPLQIYLRDVLVTFNTQLAVEAQTLIGIHSKVNVTALQMAAIVVATIPILCVYPFVQKHFVKGVMIGAIKE